MQSFDSWYRDAIALARAHGIEEVFDPQYRPSSYDEFLQFKTKQSFMYAALRYSIRPTELRQYVEQHAATSDAQAVMIDILDHIRNSTHAMISTKDMLTEITTARLDPRKYTGKTYDYIVKFDALITLYNTQQRTPELHLNDHTRCQYLQNALSSQCQAISRCQ